MTPRRRIGVLELAGKLCCHPMSVPRLVKQKRLPAPMKVLNKNTWWEDEIEALLAKGGPPPPEDLQHPTLRLTLGDENRCAKQLQYRGNKYE